MDDIEARIEEEMTYARKSTLIGYVLWFGLFGFGAHRMYLSRLGSGLCQLALFLIWAVAFGAVAVMYFVSDAYAVESAEPPPFALLLAFGSIAVMAVWFLWTLVDAFFIPRWVREDTEEKRAAIEARLRG